MSKAIASTKALSNYFKKQCSENYLVGHNFVNSCFQIPDYKEKLL